MSFLKRHALTLVLMQILSASAFAENASLIIASCPPWKHGANDAQTQQMLDMCQRDSDLMADTLASTFNISAENQIILLQEDATPLNMARAMDQFRDSLTPGDTLFIFQMSHGGILPHTYKGHPVSGEVFAYFTEEEPADVSNAPAAGLWLSGRDLRDEVSTFVHDTQVNVMMIIEACHAASSGHDLIHNPFLHLSDAGKLGMIFSAADDQTSTFTDDQNGARFTEAFAEALSQAQAGDTLSDIFNVAQDETHRGALNYCNQLPEEIKSGLFDSVDQYFENCLQSPSFFDPRGLMLDIEIVKS